MKYAYLFRGVLLVLCFLTFYTAKASHIVGGDIFYECLGPSLSDPTRMDYRITVKIYLNCNNQSMDDFSDPAPITIYRGNGAIYDFIRNDSVPLLSQADIPPDNNPCLTLPPDVCVKQGIYQYEVSLPISTESYHVTYQRCCRNASISNIVEPDRIGATYTIEITPSSQMLCNNSPTFNNFPPIIICAGFPIDFDHSATDAEGDQLVYELCGTLEGAGPEGAFEPGDPLGCNGFMPNPSCPPPYEPVEYTVPVYDALNPMGGNPQVTIDANTGLITGTPEILGQYVVGICVSEYRNGELLSVIQRDFQFNVAFCEPLIFADMVADEVVPEERLYIFNRCDNSTIVFDNLSVQEDQINSYYWNFDLNTQSIEFTTKDVQTPFPGPGTYNGYLILNQEAQLCSDTAYIEVNIFPDVDADFEFVYDTCVAGPVEFTDLSVTDADSIVQWDWEFGDQFTSSEQNPIYRYIDASNYLVSLLVTDDNGCQDRVEKTVNWFPAPPIIIVDPSTFRSCPPEEVVFTNLSSPINDDYDVLWDFGDGMTSTELNPSYVYTSTGVYDISLSITSPIGCMIDTTFSEWIRVFPVPTAAFSFTPDFATNFEPTVDFIDESIDAVWWGWDFGNGGFAYEQNPSYVFPDTGWQEIQLVITNEFGCLDTAYRQLDVIPMIRYFLPNAFTPNDDGLNELFVAQGFFRGINQFDLQIWNRWGEAIFSSTSPDIGWNGKHQNVGKMSPNGVYIYQISFLGPRGKPYNFRGFATLIR